MNNQDISNVLARHDDLKHASGDAEHTKVTWTRHQQVMQRILDEKPIETRITGRGRYPDRHCSQRWSKEVGDHHVMKVSEQLVLEVKVGWSRRHSEAARTGRKVGGIRTTLSGRLR